MRTRWTLWQLVVMRDWQRPVCHRSLWPLVRHATDHSGLWFTMPPISLASGSQCHRSLWSLVHNVTDHSGLWFTTPPISLASGIQCHRSLWPVVHNATDLSGLWHAIDSSIPAFLGLANDEPVRSATLLRLSGTRCQPT